MLNTPKYSWDIKDIAKARALLSLVRELEDNGFVVYHQPRAGLDYFSPDLNKAKVQLAAVTAMMDDIEPENEQGPDIIHVVSYSEAVHLATPPIINESIQITLHALQAYRKAKRSGKLENMKHQAEVDARTMTLYREVKNAVRILELNIPELYTAKGLYEVFHKGVFATPYLQEGREEFKVAIKWKTALIDGGMQVVDTHGKVISFAERFEKIFSDKIYNFKNIKTD